MSLGTVGIVTDIDSEASANEVIIKLLKVIPSIFCNSIEEEHKSILTLAVTPQFI